MRRILRLLTVCLSIAWGLAPTPAHSAAGPHNSQQRNVQETGFLNRRIQFRGVAYRFLVYLP